MSRVLHLVDPRASDGGPCVLKRVARVVAPDDIVIALGSSAEISNCRACDLRVDGAVPVPAGVPRLAARALKSAVRDDFDPSLVHAWSERALAVAGAAFGRSRPLLLTASLPPQGTGRLPRGTSSVIATDDVIADAWRRTARRPGGDVVTVVADRPEPSRVQGSDWLERRLRWGADEDTFVVGLLVEPAVTANLHAAAHAAARLEIVNVHARVVMPASHPHRVAVKRILGALTTTEVFIVDEDVRRPWTVLPSLDAVLHVSRAGAEPDVLARSTTGPLQWAMAVGVPIVADDSDVVRASVTHDESALLIDATNGPSVIEAIRALRDDTALAGRLAECARGIIESRPNERETLDAMYHCISGASTARVDVARGDHIRMS